MKKVFLAMLFVLIGCLLFSCTIPNDNPTPDHLSNDTTLNLESINGVAVSNGKVVLTTDQYQEILSTQNLKTICEYSLAEKASVQISLDDKLLTFKVTAEDGTEAASSVELVVLSNDVALNVGKVNGVDVRDKKATLTTAQYLELTNTQDLMSICEYSLADKASLQIALDDKVLTFKVTAEDGTEAISTVTLVVLSNDVTLCVSKINGVVVYSEKATLTTAQYQELTVTQDLLSLCEYSLADKASVQASLDNKVLTFKVTAEDGTEATATVELIVLSNNTALVVHKINDVDIAEEKAILTTAQYQEITTASSLKDLCTYTLAEGASVEVTLNNKIITFIVTAEDGTTASATVELVVLSDDTTLAASKIGGVNIADGKVVLTTAQYEALVASADLKSACEYTLADGASVEVALNGKNVIFSITAEDGTTASATIELVVLSNDTSLTISAVMGELVSNGTVILTDAQWTSLAEIKNNISTYITATAAKGAAWNASFDSASKKITFNIVAEDGTTATKQISAQIKNQFIKYGDNEFGSLTAFVWDAERLVWMTNSSNAYTSFAKDGVALKGSYAFEADFSIEEMKTNSEIVLEAFGSGNKLLRLVVRGTGENSFRIFTDLRNNTGWLNDTTLYTNASYDGSYFTLGVIVYKGSMVMQINGETVYRRGLDGFDYSQFVLANTSGMKSTFKNVEMETDEALVKSMHDSALVGYNDPYLTKTIGSTFNLGVKTSEDYENESFSLWAEKDANSNYSLGASGSFTHLGNPIVGYSWAVSGTIEVLYYGSNPHIAFYIYKDNSNYTISCLNLNSSSGNNCMYELYNDSILGNKKSTQVPNTRGIMVNEYGVISKVDDNGTQRYHYEAPFTIIFNDGKISFYLANVLVYERETSYDYTNAIIQARKTCKLTFSNIETTMDSKRVEEIYLSMSNQSAPENDLEGDIFKISGFSYEKTDREYANAAYAPNGTVFKSSDFYATFTMQNQDASTWGQSEVSLIDDNGNGVRFVHEYLADGTYQIFTERIVDGNHMGWILLASGVRRDIHAGVIVHNGEIKFLYKNNGYEYMYTYKASDVFTDDECSMYFGGKGNTVRIHSLSVNTNESEVESFAQSLTEYKYVSAYEQRAVTYATNNANAAKGQTLLIGTSTLDYWVSTHKDSYGDYVNGYLAGFEGYTDADEDGKPDVLNFGIGATTFRDWFTFYDRLIKEFQPTKIILNCGANDLAQGDSAQTTYESFVKFMNMIRADFPTIEVYVVLINPSPSMYGDALRDKTIAYNARLVEYAQNNKNVTIIDMTDGLADGTVPKAEMWDATNHLSKAGYLVYTNYIRKALGLPVIAKD